MKDKTKDNKNKPFYAKWWFWLILGLILCGNIAVLIWVSCSELKSNLLTLISGWVSFVATLLIGVIAFKQSEDYKKENEASIQYQNDEQWKKMYYDMLTEYIADIREFQNRLNDFALINNVEIIKDGNIKRYFYNFQNYQGQVVLTTGLWALQFDKYDELNSELSNYYSFLRKNLDVKKDTTFIKDATDFISKINRCFIYMLADMQTARSGLVLFNINTAKEEIRQRELVNKKNQENNDGQVENGK